MAYLPDRPHIYVNGSATLDVEPDVAHITVELKHVNDDAANAKRDVDNEYDMVRPYSIAHDRIPIPFNIPIAAACSCWPTWL